MLMSLSWATSVQTIINICTTFALQLYTAKRIAMFNPTKRNDYRSANQRTTTRFGLRPILNSISEKVRRRGGVTKVPKSPDSTALIQYEESFQRSCNYSIRSIEYSPYLASSSRNSRDGSEYAVAWDSANSVASNMLLSNPSKMKEKAYVHDDSHTMQDTKSMLAPFRRFDLTEMEDFERDIESVDSSRLTRHGTKFFGALLCPLGGCRNRNSGILLEDNFYDSSGTVFDNATAVSTVKINQQQTKVTPVPGSTINNDNESTKLPTKSPVDTDCVTPAANRSKQKVDYSIFRPLKLDFSLAEDSVLFSADSCPFNGIEPGSDPIHIPICITDSLDDILSEDVIPMKQEEHDSVQLKEVKTDEPKLISVTEKDEKQEERQKVGDAFVKIHVTTQDYPTTNAIPKQKIMPKRRLVSPRFDESPSGRNSPHDPPPKSIDIPKTSLHEFMSNKSKVVGVASSSKVSSVKVSEISGSDDDSKSSSRSTLSNDRHTLRRSNLGANKKVDLEDDFFRTLWVISDNFYNERQTKSSDIRQRALDADISAIDCSNGCAILSGQRSTNSTCSSDCSKKVTIENDYMDWLNAKIDQVLDQIEFENEIVDQIENRFERHLREKNDVRSSRRRQGDKSSSSSRISEWDERDDANWYNKEDSDNGVTVSFLEESFEPILKPICRMVMASQLPPVPLQLPSSKDAKSKKKKYQRQSSCKSMTYSSQQTLESTLPSLPSISMTYTDQATI